jgi:26S proteasome non-ATPase regulatory subunit 9
VGDKIVSFGSVTAANSSGSLQKLAEEAQRSEDRVVELLVLRADAPVVLLLRPRRWQGRGILGCHVLPL